VAAAPAKAYITCGIISLVAGCNQWILETVTLSLLLLLLDATTSYVAAWMLHIRVATVWKTSTIILL
jgi:hypothetical protein